MLNKNEKAEVNTSAFLMDKLYNKLGRPVDKIADSNYPLFYQLNYY